jgi:hypothetical protein
MLMNPLSWVRRTVLVALVHAIVVVGMVGVADANGRLPGTVSVHLRTGSTTDLMVWSTWGFLISRDDGRSFRWMCENALKVGGSFDPDFVFRSDGAVIATTFEGLLINRDGCVFEPSGLGLTFISTVAEGPDGAIYAGAVERNDSKIYKSNDGGQTFASIAEPGLVNDWWESMEAVALPAGPTRIYLSGYRLVGGVKQQLLFRSDDSGASFRALPIPQAGTGLSSDLEIAAVSPDDPALLFARVTYALGDAVLGDRFYRSTDAGESWSGPVLYVPDGVPGFVVRRNGEVIAASAKSGTWKSTDGGITFAPQATSLQTQCLVERSDQTLFACAQNFDPDNMAIGRSKDGMSWTKVFRFSEAVGPVDCPISTLQCDTCQLAVWCGLREQFGIAADPTTCAEPGDDATTCGGAASDGGGCCGVDGDSRSSTTGLLLGSLVIGLLALRGRSRSAKE